jgi:hypothetical protein
MSSEKQEGSRVAKILYERTMLRNAEQVVRFEYLIDRMIEEDVWIEGMTIRLSREAENEYLVILRAVVGGEAKVTFQSGTTLLDSLVGLLRRLENRSLEWKEDKYAK